VWRGDFAAEILAKCPSIKRYYMLDPWRPLPEWNKPLNHNTTVFEEAYATARAVTKFADDRIVILRGTTTEVIDQIPDGSLDFAYVDGDHTLRGITIDLTEVAPKVRAEGYLTGDDLVPTIWQHNSHFEPTLIFPYALYFAEALRAPIYALPYSQFLIHKTAARGYSFTDLVGSYGKHDVLHHVTPERMVRKRIGEILKGR